ncbi:unnamed protein product [Bursaphelenchus xylophilus]|uniref:(pine wood nematode) hypothetical protein n=1 Tax=Bursaphelenchus xylophilus TaxID=6326 RepID=A0A7I8WT91_BURXY|nr:unnamed protein product [Bursaphelenchus xylophilus]CAG9115981.1 unnamed protein product [Bursaphelenchus xylophilus]
MKEEEEMRMKILGEEITRTAGEEMKTDREGNAMNGEEEVPKKTWMKDAGKKMMSTSQREQTREEEGTEADPKKNTEQEDPGLLNDCQS